MIMVCIIYNLNDMFQGRVRILSLIVQLFSVSGTVASAIYQSNLLGLFEAEICKANDMLETLSILELLYEVQCLFFLQQLVPFCTELQFYS